MALTGGLMTVVVRVSAITVQESSAKGKTDKAEIRQLVRGLTYCSERDPNHPVGCDNTSVVSTSGYVKYGELTGFLKSLGVFG